MKEIIWLLFFTNGRLNRKGFWLFFGPVFLYSFVQSLSPPAEMKVVPFYTFIPFFIFIWCGFAVTIKRYHDLGRTGWWSLLWFAPIVNLWLLVECGLFPSEKGENKYGNYKFLSNT